MACEATWNGLAPFKELDDASFYSIEASSTGALSPASQSALQQTLDALGCISAEEQGLKSPITTWEKLCASNSDQLFLSVVEEEAVAFARFGTKKLYLVNGSSYEEHTCLCLLDVCVTPQQQRKGRGIALLRAAFQELGDVQAGSIAYDRPSAKMLPFLSKHFALSRPMEQPNKFVIFPAFFGQPAQGASAAGKAVTSRHHTAAVSSASAGVRQALAWEI